MRSSLAFIRETRGRIKDGWGKLLSTLAVLGPADSKIDGLVSIERSFLLEKSFSRRSKLAGMVKMADCWLL